MTGHLDAEQLKSMKREELQALAKELGVNAGGKTEEIIARIVAVEVDAPEKKESTEEEKAAESVTVKAVTRFLDKQLNQIKDAGEDYSVSRERAAELAAAGVAEIVG